MNISDWKEVKLGDICKIRRGSSPRPIKDYLSNSGMPWVKIADATESNSRFIEKTNQYIKMNGVDKSVVVNPGSLILSNSGTAGLPKFMGIKACIHDGWQVFDDLQGIDIYYLFYRLLHIRKKLLHGAYDSTMKNLTLDMVRDTSIDLPPISEQKAIADTLSCLDNKVELNNMKNKTIEEMAQAIFKSWFVDFEPFQDGEFEDSELGMIPKEWRIGTLGDIANITMGQSPKGSSYNENNTGTIFYQGRTDFGKRYPTIRLYTTEPKRVAKKGDILMSVRAPVGDINVASDDCCIGRGLASLRSKNNCNSYLLYQLLDFKSRFNVYNGEGTVFGSVNKGTLNNMQIIIPSEKIMFQFQNIVGKLDDIIENNFIQNRTLIAIRDSLIPKLMSGKIRVPIEEVQ